jgi:hypothetical protein
LNDLVAAANITTVKNGGKSMKFSDHRIGVRRNTVPNLDSRFASGWQLGEKSRQLCQFEKSHRRPFTTVKTDSIPLIGDGEMATFILVFNGRSFQVPKKSLFELFEQHQELFPATSYAVQSSVPVDLFEQFVSSLKTQTKISVTKGNAASLSLLAREFFLGELAAECAAFSVPVDPVQSRVFRTGSVNWSSESPPSQHGRVR